MAPVAQWHQCDNGTILDHGITFGATMAPIAPEAQLPFYTTTPHNFNDAPPEKIKGRDQPNATKSSKDATMCATDWKTANGANGAGSAISPYTTPPNNFNDASPEKIKERDQPNVTMSTEDATMRANGGKTANGAYGANVARSATSPDTTPPHNLEDAPPISHEDVKCRFT